MLNSTHILLLLFAFSTCVVLSNKDKLISMLISLELLMFLLLCFILYTSTVVFSNTTLLAFLMCIAASGGAVGLTMLISMSRLHGNDFVTSLA